jgi:hypothetical protein
MAQVMSELAGVSDRMHWQDIWCLSGWLISSLVIPHVSVSDLWDYLIH